MWVRGYVIFCGLLAAGALARTGYGGTVYAELGNSGTQITTNYSTSTQTTLNLTSPYGTHILNTAGGGVEISFSPTSQFKAVATGNSNGGVRVETDGKITFTLVFDSPILLSATIVEGGQYSTTGVGALATIAGGVIVETIDPLGNRESIGGTGNLATYGTDNRWTSTIDLGSFTHSYTAYRFSIDNYLRADALGIGSASISKDTFTIIIPPPGGAGGSAPLPVAAVGGSALGALVLLFRKRVARSLA